MHFGEYLAQQRILSPHQILKALAEQRRRRPYLPLVLVDLGALPDYMALRLSTQAVENGEEFLDTLLRERFITKEQRDQIFRKWHQCGPPLGHLLVEMGLIDEETRIDALADFQELKQLHSQRELSFAEEANLPQ